MRKTKLMLQIASTILIIFGVAVAILATVYEEFPKAWWLLRFGVPLGVALFFAGIILWNVAREKKR